MVNVHSSLLRKDNSPIKPVTDEKCQLSTCKRVSVTWTGYKTCDFQLEGGDNILRRARKIKMKHEDINMNILFFKKLNHMTVEQLKRL